MIVRALIVILVFVLSTALMWRFGAPQWAGIGVGALLALVSAAVVWASDQLVKATVNKFDL